MSQSSLHPSGMARINQIQENFIAYFRLFAGLPGVIFVEEDITWIFSKVPGKTVLKTNISDDVTEQRMNEVFSQFGQHCDHFDWLVFPSCRPRNLGERLVVKGKQGGPEATWSLHGEIGAQGGIWMLADLKSMADSPPVPARFHTERVSDPTLLEEWRRINSEGFGASVESGCQTHYDAYAGHGFESDATALHYIGYLDDKPVTSATLLLAGGIASVYGDSTPPYLRRKGFGSAVTFAAFQDAYERGYETAFVQSSRMGVGAYRRIGFVTTDLGIREFQWKKVTAS